MPDPAVDGSNEPVAGSVIPVPLQVPPGSAPTIVTIGSPGQKGPIGVIDASASELMVIDVVPTSPQAPEMEYVIV